MFFIRISPVKVLLTLALALHTCTGILTLAYLHLDAFTLTLGYLHLQTFTWILLRHCKYRSVSVQV